MINDNDINMHVLLSKKYYDFLIELLQTHGSSSRDLTIAEALKNNETITQADAEYLRYSFLKRFILNANLNFLGYQPSAVREKNKKIEEEMKKAEKIQKRLGWVV